MKKLLLVTVLTLSFFIKSSAQIGINQPSDYEICGDDDFGVFDLPIKDVEILNGLSSGDYLITYHLTLQDANADNNILISPYTNVVNPQTIYARVFELSTGNFEVTSFDLVVSSIINMDLGLEDMSLCPGETLVFDTGLDNSTFSFTWYIDGQLIPGEVQSTLSVNQAGSYSVEVSDSSSDCISVDSGLVTDFGTAISSPSPLVVCDDDEDGHAIFDLTLKDAEITNNLSNINITYHETLIDADFGINALSSPYINIISHTQTIYARIQNQTGDCHAIASFNIEASINECIDDTNVTVDTSTYTVEELVQDILIGNECSQISNITYSTGTDFGPNEPNGIGYFQYSGNNFPFSEGLVLTTGNVTNAGGPNNTTVLSDGTNNWPGDVDLDTTIPGVDSNNATYIEFDFIPVVNQINFNFLMASEEYNGGSGGTFECDFSDAFAFLLTDSSGVTTNLAVLPGTTTPILVTNIHPQNPGCAAINEEYFGGYISQNQPPIAYDGRTVSFSAQANVNIGETYHIKLVVADDRDNIFDSAVFLEAGSLDIGDLCDDIGLINLNAFNDSNVNGTFDNGETKFTNGSFTYEKNNDGVVNVVNSSNGSFTIVSTDETDTYDITYSVNDEYTNCYSQTITSFEDVSVTLGELAQVEFPIEDNLICEDLGVYLINPFNSPRPGFEHTNLLYIENLSGVTIASGSVEFVLDENLVINNTTLSNSNLSITSSGTGFTLDFTNLGPSQSEYVDITLFCPATVELGELVINTASYTTTTNDTYVENNVSTLSQEVIGSYDPNDKAESQGPRIVYDDFITSDEWLYYTIRFQNLGTAEAIFVRIEDALDDQLDESTFQMLRSSHDYVVTRTGKDLEWFFDDINLPAEQDDAEGSNGFVYFRVKPLAGYGVGDIIPNSAAIYFDFNAPVITNTFTTTFVETLSTNDFNRANFNIYPNPAKDDVTIALQNGLIDEYQISIVDIQGKIINVPQLNDSNSIALNVSSLNAGLYFVQLKKGNAVLVEKLIIE